jgi:hypothetical protein
MEHLRLTVPSRPDTASSRASDLVDLGIAVRVDGGSVIGAVILLLVYRAVSRRRGGRRALSA